MTLTLPPGELVLSSTADEQEWLAARRTGIGASEIAAVAGLSTRRGPFDVWQAKVDGGELEPTDEMLWGKWIERRIIDWWAARTGREVADGGLFRHPVHRWLMATPDAVVLQREAAPAAPAGSKVLDADIWATAATVDAKNAGHYNAVEWDEDGAPVEYLAQITQQMLAVGVRTGFLVAAIGGRPPVERRVELDEDFARMLIAAGEQLWEHVQDGTAPPVDGSRAARKWLAARYPDADPDARLELSDEDVAALREKLSVDEQIARLQKISDQVENQIKAKLGKAATGTYGGKPYCTWKSIERKGYTVKAGRYRKFHIPAAVERELRHG